MMGNHRCCRGSASSPTEVRQPVAVFRRDDCHEAIGCSLPWVCLQGAHRYSSSRSTNRCSRTHRRGRRSRSRSYSTAPRSALEASTVLPAKAGLYPFPTGGSRVFVPILYFHVPCARSLRRLFRAAQYIAPSKPHWPAARSVFRYSGSISLSFSISPVKARRAPVFEIEADEP